MLNTDTMDHIPSNYLCSGTGTGLGTGIGTKEGTITNLFSGAGSQKVLQNSSEALPLAIQEVTENSPFR